MEALQYPPSIVKNSPSESLTPRSVNQYCLLPNKKGIHLYIYVQKHVVTEETTCSFFAIIIIRKIPIISKACPPPSPIWSPHSDSCSRTVYTLSVSVNSDPLLTCSDKDKDVLLTPAEQRIAHKSTSFSTANKV